MKRIIPNQKTPLPPGCFWFFPRKRGNQEERQIKARTKKNLTSWGKVFTKKTKKSMGEPKNQTFMNNIFFCSSTLKKKQEKTKKILIFCNGIKIKIKVENFQGMGSVKTASPDRIETSTI